MGISAAGGQGSPGDAARQRQSGSKGGRRSHHRGAPTKTDARRQDRALHRHLHAAKLGAKATLTPRKPKVSPNRDKGMHGSTRHRPPANNSPGTQADRESEATGAWQHTSPCPARPEHAIGMPRPRKTSGPDTPPQGPGSQQDPAPKARQGSRKTDHCQIAFLTLYFYLGIVREDTTPVFFLSGPARHDRVLFGYPSGPNGPDGQATPRGSSDLCNRAGERP